MEDDYRSKTLEILKLAGFSIDEDGGNITRPDHFISMTIGEYLENSYDTICYYDYEFNDESSKVTPTSGTVRLPDTNSPKELAISIRDYFNEDKERCDKLANKVLELYSEINPDALTTDDYKVDEVTASLPYGVNIQKKGLVYITTYVDAKHGDIITTSSPYNYITKQLSLQGEAHAERASQSIIKKFELVDINNTYIILEKLRDMHDALYEKIEAMAEPDERPFRRRLAFNPEYRDPDHWEEDD